MPLSGSTINSSELIILLLEIVTLSMEKVILLMGMEILCLGLMPLKKKKPSLNKKWWACLPPVACLVFQDLPFLTARSQIMLNSHQPYFRPPRTTKILLFNFQLYKKKPFPNHNKPHLRKSIIQKSRPQSNLKPLIQNLCRKKNKNPIPSHKLKIKSNQKPHKLMSLQEKTSMITILRIHKRPCLSMTWLS